MPEDHLHVNTCRENSAPRTAVYDVVHAVQYGTEDPRLRYRKLSSVSCQAAVRRFSKADIYRHDPL